MGTKTKTTTVNQPPQFVEQPKNPYYEKSRELIDAIDYRTPVIDAYGRQDNEIRESGNEIFGANTSPEAAQRVRENRLFRSKIDKGTALAGAVQNENNTKNAGYMSLGGATAPVMYNPGGTTTQSTPFSFGSLLAPLAMGGAQVASAGMAPGA